MSYATATDTDAIETGINKHLVRFQGLIISSLLGVAVFFLVQVYFTVKDIDQDNRRFNTYIVKNDLRQDGFERDLTDIKDDVKKLKEGQTEQAKREADEWSEFWKDYGYFFNVNGRPRYVKPR